MPHCGLPHDVSVLGHERPWPKDRFDFEAYPEPLEVAFKRPVWTLLTEFNQRCHARFAIDDFDAETAASVSAMRKIAEQLHQDLARVIHEVGIHHCQPRGANALRLSCPKRRAWKPEAQAKDMP